MEHEMKFDRGYQDGNVVSATLFHGTDELLTITDDLMFSNEMYYKQLHNTEIVYNAFKEYVKDNLAQINFN